jgi:hypothetical protein
MYEITKNVISALSEALNAMEEKQNRIIELVDKFDNAYQHVVDAENAKNSIIEFCKEYDISLKPNDDTLYGIIGTILQHSANQRVMKEAIIECNQDLINENTKLKEKTKKWEQRSDTFEAKAAKLNSEKRKLLELIKEPFNGGEKGILNTYNKWLKQQAKKRRVR